MFTSILATDPGSGKKDNEMSEYCIQYDQRYILKDTGVLTGSMDSS